MKFDIGTRFVIICVAKKHGKTNDRVLTANKTTFLLISNLIWHEHAPQSGVLIPGCCCCNTPFPRFGQMRFWLGPTAVGSSGSDFIVDFINYLLNNFSS